MPMFPEVNAYYKGRTHTSLVVSEGNAPAERYIPSASETVKFQYEFGPEGNQNVVIPKGKAVAIAGVEWDYETERYVPAIKIADGTTDDIIGINHHNVYERRRDRFSGNQPTIITREYIELPLFPSKSVANAIKFGAAWVELSGSPTSVDYANAIIGKKIAVDEYGNLTVADGTTYTNVIGQCLGVETDLPPHGFLQFFLDMNDTQFAEFMKQMSYAPSPGRTKDAEWNDVGTYPLGTSYLKDKKDLIRNFRSGIPFLTDGYFRARTNKTYTLDTTGVALKYSGHVTVTEGYNDGTNTFTAVSCSDVIGAALFIKLPDKLAFDALKTGAEAGPEFGGTNPSDVKVYIGDYDSEVQVSPANIHVDYTNNMIVVYLTTPITNANVKIEATVLENQIPGIPTGWDFNQSLGAVRILLQK